MGRDMSLALFLYQLPAACPPPDLSRSLVEIESPVGVDFVVPIHVRPHKAINILLQSIRPH